MTHRALALCLLAACATTPTSTTPPALPAVAAGRSVIVVVWDGLRPDAIDPAITPNLARLRDTGVDFTDHHATYPTFTMMNSASFASGAFPEATGYYGNVLWQPDARGSDSAGKPVDYRQPVFSEDYGILDGLKGQRREVLGVDTLFDAAQAAGLATLALGKSGAAYLQDSGRGGLVLDERIALPLAFARELQSAGIALPPTAPGAFPAGELTLAEGNDNPVAFAPVKRLPDGVSSDPADASGSPYKGAIAHLVHAYLAYILPHKQPRLTVVWLREPDSTQHAYGVGSPNWRDALAANDHLLGELVARLEELGQAGTTDVLVVSDHGHSNVSGARELFPLRALRDGAPAEIADDGHAASGLVRLADLLRRAGFTAFDGLGCTFVSYGAGVRRDGTPVYPVQIDRDGTVCGQPGQRYQAPAYKVPAQLPARALVVAVNGGSDYIYAPDHDPAVIARAVRFLQQRAEVGAIFVDDRYGAIPGTLPLGAIHARSAAGAGPDIILAYDHDEAAVIAGIHGTEMAGMLNGATFRGMHGSFSPRDVHNTLIGYGPDFRPGFRDPLPTANVDLAPTVARLLGLALPHAQGRPLLEALRQGAALGDFQVARAVQRPRAPATDITVRLPTDPDGKDIAATGRTYSFELHTKTLRYAGRAYTYYDFAKAFRR